MFVISQSESYKWPVKVEVPSDGGKFEAQTFDAIFKRVTQTRIKEIQKLNEESLITDVDLAREVLTGWSGITDANNGEVPFTDSMRDRLLDIPSVASAITLAWMASLQGAKRKN